MGQAAQYLLFLGKPRNGCLSKPRTDQKGSSDAQDHADASIPDLVMDAETRIYKVKPFGLDESVNMRNLNPNGE